MTKTYYHATDFSNYASIMDKGILKGYDGYVYLTETPDDALKFMLIRGTRQILVLEVELEEDLVSESFDHSEAFFKCKAYMYPEDIDVFEIANARMYKSK